MGRLSFQEECRLCARRNVSHLSTGREFVNLTRPAVRVEIVAEEPTNPRFSYNATGEDIIDTL